MGRLRVLGRMAVLGAVVLTLIAVAPSALASPVLPVPSLAPVAVGQPGDDGEVGTAEAPVGVQCGAYRDMGGDVGHLRYRHCGPTSIVVEVDMRYRDNKFVCVKAWADVFLERYIFADNAWYVRTTDLC